MITAPQVLAVAASQIGYSRWDDPEEGTKYGRWYAELTGSPYFGTSGVPFCAMGATWCFHAAGDSQAIPGGHFAYVPAGIQAARNESRLVPIRQALPADLVCFDWDDDGVADHVGIVEANAGSYLQTIEFNTSSGGGGSQSNGGGVHRRTRGFESVCAVIRPYLADHDSDAGPSSLAGYRDITGLQTAVGAEPDNVCGPDTRLRLFAVAAASTWGGHTFPMGVEYAQSVVGATPDGIWGDESDAAHDRTVGRIQRAVGVADDEVYGAITNAAVNAALAGAEKP